MAAKSFSHHFVPHQHIPLDGSGEVVHHRAHALNQGALLGYLVVFILTIAGFYFLRINAPQILGTAQYTGEQIIQLTNIKRAEYGLSPLVSNPLLSLAASAKADDMFSDSYWAHYSPSGKTPWKFITEAGYKYIYAGENLARDFNDPVDVVNAWMASPTHRSNVLDENFKEIGVAVENGNLSGREGVLVVQMFGSSVSGITASELLAQGENQLSEVAQGESTAESSQNENSQATTSFEPSTVSPNKPTTALINPGSATVLASRQFSLSKIISLIFVGLVFGLFLVEVAVVSKRSHLSLKSSTLAHLGILGLVLFALWWATAGAVI